MRPLAIRILPLVLLAASSAPSLGQGAPGITNGGFEGAADGMPLDWEVLGEGGLTDEARSGESAFRVTRPAGADTAETGLNRAWSPRSGTQGAMLGWVRGAVTFWYRVPLADDDAAIRFNIIPMTAEPLEHTAVPRAYYDVPKSHVGDGEWHRGVIAYDFRFDEEVRWVQVSPRITGGGAEWILDDIEWIPQVGPFLTIDRFDVLEGRRILRARVANVGDAPSPLAAPVLTLPPGLRAEPLNGVPLPGELAPGRRAHRHWRLEGTARDGDVVTATLPPLGEGMSPVQESVTLEARVIAYSLMADPPVLEPGQEATITLGAKNYGPVDSGPVRIDVELPGTLELVDEVPDATPIAQGAWAPHRFRVRALAATPAATLRGTVSVAGERWPVSTTITIAPPAGLDAATVQTGNARLVIARSPWGPGPVRVEARQEGVWSTVGWLPHLGRVVTLGADGEDELLTLAGEASPSPEGVAFSGATMDSAGATWESDVRITFTSTPGLVSLSYRVRCDRDRPVRSFEGPALLVSAQADEGLLPGVEWVQGADETSSNRDLALSTPDRLRFVPDGYDITIPLMAVRGGGVTTALLWDIHQRWDTNQGKPAAYFSRPGYLAGSADAAMGLLVPSVGEGWLSENRVRADEPYPLVAGRPLRIEASLLVRTGSATVLDAVDAWVDRYGLADPGGPPRGDWTSEVEFSARAYLESLYDPEAGDWWITRGGGPLLSPKVAASPHFAWDLAWAARLTDDPSKAESFREWSARLAGGSGAAPRGLDGGLEYADGADWLNMLASAAGAARQTQREDGSWGYDADRRGEGVFAEADYWELGDLGESELGTNARRAVDLLRYARATGDYEAYEAGRRALEYMARFTVPRAGQVWEVPAHVPDIIAAADAIEAYLEAHRIDGDPYWVDRAVYWAMAGLPFVYLWGEAERPYLQYASIAVYGGTFHVMNWIGRPVQWCGLNYATALHQLAEFDDTQDWRRVAEGLLVSALHQQSTEAEDVALWPDAIGARAGDKSAWVFGPSKIYEHLYTMLGVPAAPRTALVGEGGDRVHISVVGEVLEARLGDGALSVNVDLHPKGRSRLLVGPIAPPREVLVNGAPMAQGVGPQEWVYLARYRVVSVPLTEGGEHQVRIPDVARVPLPEAPPTVFELAFEFEGSDEGWQPHSGVGLLAVEDGILRFGATGADPYVVREAMSVPTHLGDRLTVRMSVDAPGAAQVFWTTEDAPAFTEAQSFHFVPIADGQMHEYSFPVGLHPEWPGRTLTALRIDPTVTGPASVAIDRIARDGGGP